MTNGLSKGSLINSKIMTALNLKISITSIFIALFSFTSNAQQLYGDNPEMCKQKLSIMTTYYKQKAYSDAASSWRYVFTNCPQASKNTFIIGSKIMEHLIKQESNKELQEQYVDTLLMIQDERISHFPENKVNKIIAKKAIYLLKYRLKKEYNNAFTLLDSAFSNGASELSAYDFKMYMYCYKLMVKSKQKTCDQMLDSYLQINSIVNDRESKGKKIKKKTKQQITEYAEICMDCELLDSLYANNFSANKSDTTWLDQGIYLFKLKKCNSSKAFLLLLETRYVSNPNAKTASILGKYYMNKQNLPKANTYLSEAISLETDTLKKGNHHVSKAKYFIQVKKYSDAMLEAKKAIKLNPNNFSALILHGDAIAYSVSACSTLAFGGKEIYWLAVDYYYKALKTATTDKQKRKIRNRISKYENYFPEKGELFLKSLAEGDAYKIECLFQEKTTVRGKK